MSTSEQFALTGQGCTEPHTLTDGQSDTFGSPSSASYADISSDTTQARDHPEYVVLGSDLISNEIKELPMLYEGLIPANCIWAIIGASDILQKHAPASAWLLYRRRSRLPRSRLSRETSKRCDCMQ